MEINQLENVFGNSVNVTCKDEQSRRRVLFLQTDGNVTGAQKES